LILGAGRNPGHYTTQPRPIDVTIDRAKSAGADHTLNLTRERIPYPDGHFGEVHFEFFPNNQMVANNAFALREAARVTAPGGRLRIDTGKPLDATSLALLRQQIRSVLEAEGFTVTENTAVGHLQLEAVRGNP
jgi:ubiquinone/menaquinone biosynthesis C-methylase UbiE